MKKFLLLLLLIPTICFGDSESTIGGKTAQAHIIQAKGVSLRPRPYLNITGDSVVGTDSGGKTVITIGASGNVGIGTSGKLAVYTGTTTVGSLGTPTLCSAGQYATGINSSGNATGCTTVSSGQWLTNGSVGIGTYGSSSNVGIGTIAPSNAKLAIVGNIGIGTVAGDSYLITSPSNGGIIAYGNSGIGTYNPADNLTVNGSVIYGGIGINNSNLTGGIISNGSILNDDCSSLTGWSQDDGSVGVSSQTTFDSKSTFKFSAVSAYAGRTRTLASFGTTRTVATFGVWIDTVGPQGNGDFAGQMSNNVTTVNFYWASGGFYVYDGSAFNLLGPITTGAWQEWTLDIHWGTQLMDVYINGVLTYSNVDISYSLAAGDGKIDFYQNAGSGNKLSYIDYIKVGNGTSSNVPNKPYLGFSEAGVRKFTIGTDSSDSSKLKIGTTLQDTSTRMVIDSTGNVGIGTITPTATFEVKGGMNVFNSTSTVTKKSSANQACNTTCAGSMCIYAEDTGVIGTTLACTDATADVCECLGP